MHIYIYIHTHTYIFCAVYIFDIVYYYVTKCSVIFAYMCGSSQSTYIYILYIHNLHSPDTVKSSLFVTYGGSWLEHLKDLAIHDWLWWCFFVFFWYELGLLRASSHWWMYIYIHVYVHMLHIVYVSIYVYVCMYTHFICIVK